MDETRKLGLVNERVPLVDEMSGFKLGDDGERERDVAKGCLKRTLSIRSQLLGTDVCLDSYQIRFKNKTIIPVYA